MLLAVPLSLRWLFLLPEAVAVLVRGDEGFDHLGRDEVAAVVVELREPEVEAREVVLLLGRVVGVAPEVTEVLHEDERAVLLAPVELRVLYDRADCGGAPLRRVVRAELIDYRVALRDADGVAGVGAERVHEV